MTALASAKSIWAVTRVDGTQMTGPALADLVAAADPAVDAQLRAELDATVTALAAIKAAAEGGFAYDQMLEAGNEEGEALIMGGVNALITQTASIERAVTALGLSTAGFEGSDSLDNPNAVFQRAPRADAPCPFCCCCPRRPWPVAG